MFNHSSSFGSAELSAADFTSLYYTSPEELMYKGFLDSFITSPFISLITNDESYSNSTGLRSANSLVFSTNYNEQINLYESIKDGLWLTIMKFRLLFYLVWPSETMFSSLDQVPRYVTEMFPVFFLVAIIENAVRIYQGKNSIRINETIGSLSQGIFQECLRIKVRSIEVLMYCLVWNHIRLVTLPWDSLWTWWICYLSVDLGFYWAHRLAHEVNFIWAIHQAHHSSEEFSVVSALRQAVLQPFTAWVFLAHLQLSELYMAWLHTEIVDTTGPLEYILNTPSHHRVHHSRNPEYIDKNYGGMLIIWDRLFGTFKQEDKNNPPVYGLVHPVNGFNPFHVQFHTWPIIWKRIVKYSKLRDKLGVVFNGPGWKPGLKRLGNPDDLPAIVRPVNSYDPQINIWKNTYIVIHFGLLLMFYHELTLYQEQFNPLSLNIGVIALIASITSLGLMLDNRKRFNSLYELIRCLLFFQTKHIVMPILDHGLERTGICLFYKTTIMLFVYSVFALSVLINSFQLVTVKM